MELGMRNSVLVAEKHESTLLFSFTLFCCLLICYIQYCTTRFFLGARIVWLMDDVSTERSYNV